MRHETTSEENQDDDCRHPDQELCVRILTMIEMQQDEIMR